MIDQIPPETWKNLQDRCARIMQESGLQVEIGKKIKTVRGIVEIDVHAEEPETSHSTKIAVECKNWGRPIPQTVVHSFLTVVQGAGYNAGLIVSRMGFQSGARAATDSSNVILLTWSEFENRFERRWIKNHFSKEFAQSFTSIIDYLEPFNSAVDRKISKASDRWVRDFRLTREKHQRLWALYLCVASKIREFGTDDSNGQADLLLEAIRIANRSGALPTEMQLMTEPLSLRETLDKIRQLCREAEDDFKDLTG